MRIGGHHSQRPSPSGAAITLRRGPLNRLLITPAEIGIMEATWVPLPLKGTPPIPRVFHAMTAVDTSTYVFGGMASDDKGNVVLIGEAGARVNDSGGR